MSVRPFRHQVNGIDWYCEQRGEGPPVVLVPSGEGDCGVFDWVATQLANEFTILTFDTPGFSRSQAGTSDISMSKLGDQIACLLRSLGTGPSTFYGSSSGGVAVLDLVVRHGDLVRNAVVHEVTMPSAAPLVGDLLALEDGATVLTLEDAAIVERCQPMFAHMLNDDPEAWKSLGEEYHARLERNYVTWARKYAVAPVPSHSPQDLAGQPITWTIGGLTPAFAFLENVVLAVKSGLAISPLMCKHFPQVSAPEMLATHIRESVLASQGLDAGKAR